MSDLENIYQQSQVQHQALAQHEKQRLFDLANDLSKVWYNPTTDGRIKKRIIRLLINQVWIKLIAEKIIKATIH